MKFTDIYVDQGCDFSYSFELKDQDGFPLDLSNHELRGQFRQSAQSNIGYDLTVTSPNAGTVLVELSAANSEALRFPRYQYDIEIIDPNGKVTRVKEGLMLVSFGVTRPN